ncbi:MAG: ATP synthase F0 subunit A [Candidatus Levybacteria bacterium RIFCSPHIGHO2_01_FULL_37_17]|nr:MAG: ATP synthase F0 subunit A [Candidatus Levybacteria bacterium RIFCSPHIGHO2_01_FULL_37_17]OGH36710.1 MAG: ATP synthase F0 subunit A [Candidatus Levybacteria bacterium RIFCSPLOWO2_01_FULL_38_23]
MVSFAAEPIFFLGKFAITNALLDTLLVDFLLLILIIVVNKKISKIPGFLQNIVELVIEGFYDLIKSVAEERASKIFPYVVTFFLFILLANWTGLIPGIGAFGIWENHHLVPFFRPATSDFNVTLGLALISAVATHGLSITTLGIKEYLGRFISLNPIFLFVGFLEIISEFTKVISLSFRLFGNIFAGEVVLGTISALFAFLFPVPFLMLETVVGLVQALVFAMLTMAFMTILTTPHSESSKEVSR